MMPDSRFLPPCPEFLADFTDFLDGTLPPARRAKVHVHLDCCEPCLRHLSAYRRGVGVLHDSEIETDPRSFWRRLERRMWVEGHLGGGDRSPAPRPAADRWTQPAWAVAAAALFAVIIFGAGLWSTQHWPAGVPERTGDRTVVVAGPVMAAARGIQSATEPEDVELDAAVPEAGAPALRRPAVQPLPRPDRGIVLARATADETAPVYVEAEAEVPEPWVERQFRRLEEEVERGRSPAPSPPAWANGWADPLEVRPTGIQPRIRTAGFAPQAGVQVWPVEAAVTIP